MDHSPMDPPILTVVFADLVGFTAATDVHGDETAVDLAQRLAAATTSALGGRGRLVKMIGDAALCAFADPSVAVAFVERLLHNVVREPDFPALRLGLDHGPVLEANGDIFGSTVNIASRLSGVAQPGQILATGAVAAGDLGGRVARSLGSVQLRNIATPIEVFEIHFSVESEERRVDPVCQMLVGAATAVRLNVGTTGEQWFCSQECKNRYLTRPEA
jgi:class 3 adenylate cyclase